MAVYFQNSSENPLRYRRLPWKSRDLMESLKNDKFFSKHVERVGDVREFKGSDMVSFQSVLEQSYITIF